MPYYLGVDVGTTYTAAALWRDGRVEVVSLGVRAAVIPTVVFAGDTVLVGESAERRGFIEPQRVAREFKRRIGDPTPIVLGGDRYTAEDLMARMVRVVVDTVSAQEGGPPAGITVSHPANWGAYKKDLLTAAIDRAGVPDIVTISEPEAAAIHYASQERIEPGSVVAVYDLGGGTFDVALLRKADKGWEILGTPEGIERLGGIDFDEAVFRHVADSTDGALEALDEDDPKAVAAVARLRRECVDAKEALSSDSSTAIPVLLPPDVQLDVRLTRAEFEQMIRLPLRDSIEALRRALRSAKVEVDEISQVLLVGGSSRIPLVAQLVASELGRPVAVDAHPKYAVSLGAAILGAERSTADAVLTREVMIPKIEVPADPPLPEVVPVGAPPAVAVDSALAAFMAAAAQAPVAPVDEPTQASQLAWPEPAPAPPAPVPEPPVRRVYVPAPKVSPPTPAQMQSPAMPTRQRTSSSGRNRPAQAQARHRPGKLRRFLGRFFVISVVLASLSMVAALAVEATNPDVINLEDGFNLEISP
jgi:molecular chaperone DnaK (HSP70)